MRFIYSMLILLCVSANVRAAEPLEQLKGLIPFIGTWTSLSDTPDPRKRFIDVTRWEWAFGGKVVRIIHSVNDGAYAGESLIHWDNVDQQIIYRYVNNGGFYTDGVITERSYGSIIVHEYIRGTTEDGPTETRAGYSIRNGQMYSWTQFKLRGVWGEKSEVIYERTPNATPKMPPLPE
ncbi:hypothetical protein KFE96_07415 [Kordiimonas sp. SCSIO 12603]|uniref:hypothetical protein n=1 Tax=Kordiimonas sp. SCSIO 12603 TaxID=2829596 RepID=UPI0021053DA0|nr:hypothetical protein [Kordiimonas sp. SCSIO 12603]UTW60130.1 hypothetical protein KFE96_07415 [Kordiimonas sp. SCSIO 12603]